MCTFDKKQNIAAGFEWVIALIFTCYVLTFFVDLLPAWHAKQAVSNMEMGHVDGANDGSGYGAGADYSRNEYAGAYEAQDQRAAPQAVPPSRTDYSTTNGTMSSGYSRANGGSAESEYANPNRGLNRDYVNRNIGQDEVMMEHAGPGFDKVEPARNF